MVRSSNSIEASSAIETYFTKAYSILDIMAKICFEIQYLRNDFPRYQNCERTKDNDDAGMATC